MNNDGGIDFDACLEWRDETNALQHSEYINFGSVLSDYSYNNRKPNSIRWNTNEHIRRNHASYLNWVDEIKEAME